MRLAQRLGRPRHDTHQMQHGRVRLPKAKSAQPAAAGEVTCLPRYGRPQSVAARPECVGSRHPVWLQREGGIGSTRGGKTMCQRAGQARRLLADLNCSCLWLLFRSTREGVIRGGCASSTRRIAGTFQKRAGQRPLIRRRGMRGKGKLRKQHRNNHRIQGAGREDGVAPGFSRDRSEFRRGV